ncbi:CBS domain-containing protein [Streptomyces sp. NPDC093093]|uniref:CBS domain-containing protein n=1 Tax=Streptomyces sp. NPDC093093 TaxID=3366025 RepID=UPI00380A05EA
MRHRDVGELMTREVVTVPQNAAFKDIVRTLVEHQSAAQGDYFRSLPEREAWQEDKAAGLRAEEPMSAPPVCARPDWTVAEAARLMEAQGIKRLLIVDETDTLVGIVSRPDLLRIFLRDDDAIRHEITSDILHSTLRQSSTAITVDVADGRVELHGTVRFKSLIPVIERLYRTVDGVVSVKEQLGFADDDTLAP